MLRRVSADGKLRGTASYHAAHTGRFGGRGVQLQNLFRSKYSMEALIETLRQGDYDELSWAYDDVSKALASAIRGMFISEDETDFLVGDLTGIEARVLAWLAGAHDKLAAFLDGVDPYCTAASQIYGKKVDKSQKDSRLVGKVSELSLGYQGGIAAYLKMAEGYEVDLTPIVGPLWLTATPEERDYCNWDYLMYVKRCKKASTKAKPIEPCEKQLGLVCSLIKHRWRKANPKIEQYWEDIECAFITAIRTRKPVSFGKLKLFMHSMWLCVKLPSGRILRYPFPKLEVSPRGSTKISYCSMDTVRGWSRSTTYGGSLTENIVQAIARDLFVDALLKMEGTEYDVKFHVHDEAVVQVAHGEGSEREFVELLSAVPQWATGLPVSAEAWRGNRYEKR
jgi:DNA polymerase bacteriophage-type